MHSFVWLSLGHHSEFYFFCPFALLLWCELRKTPKFVAWTSGWSCGWMNNIIHVMMFRWQQKDCMKQIVTGHFKLLWDNTATYTWLVFQSLFLRYSLITATGHSWAVQCRLLHVSLSGQSPTSGSPIKRHVQSHTSAHAATCPQQHVPYKHFKLCTSTPDKFPMAWLPVVAFCVLAAPTYTFAPFNVA